LGGVGDKAEPLASMRALIPRAKKIHSEILVYKRNGAPFFRQAIPTTSTVPVSHDPSRKQFFAKLLGLTAAFGFLPKLLAKSAAVTRLPESTPVMAVRAESRAVARRVDAS
jgi:hypothetical protein